MHLIRYFTKGDDGGDSLLILYFIVARPWIKFNRKNNPENRRFENKATTNDCVQIQFWDRTLTNQTKSKIYNLIFLGCVPLHRD